MSFSSEFLLDILTKHEDGSDIKSIDSIKIEPCVPDAQNFLSVVSRLKLQATLKDGSERNMNIVVKSGKQGDTKCGYSVDKSFFVTEAKAYGIYENISEWLKRKKYSYEKMWATCYYTSLDGSNLIVMLQDLTSYDFVPHIKGRETLDELHMSVVVQRLATMHAMSRVYLYQNSDKKELAVSMNLPRYTDMKDHFTSGVTVLCESLRQLDWGNIADIVLSTAETSIDILMQEYTSIKEDFPVLTLGDCWTNNILFKYSNGEPISCAFVDFQTAHFNSFAWDLCYILFMNILPKDRFENMEKFLQLYTTTFDETVRDVGGDSSLAPSYDEVINILDKLLYSSFIFSSLGSVEIHQTTDDDFKQDKFQFKHDWFTSNFEEDGYKTNLEYFQSKGLFNRLK